MIVDTIIEKTGKYQDLRFRRTVVDAKNKSVNYVLSYPSVLLSEQKDEITDIVNQFYTLPNFKFKLTFEKDYFDDGLTREEINDYINKDFKSLASSPYFEMNVTTDQSGVINSIFKVDSELAEIIESQEFLSKIAEHFRTISVFKFSFAVDVYEREIDFDDLIGKIEQKQELLVSREISKPQRYFTVTDKRKLIGYDVNVRPKYIIDIDKAYKSCAVCGKINKIKSFMARNGETMVCKFDITDFTGSISAILFAKKGDTYGKFTLLNEGDEIIASGPIETNSFSGQLELKAYNLSLCKVIEEQEQPKFVKPCPERYITVAPERYVNPVQMSLTQKKVEVCDYLKNNTVVAFDFETTGLKVLQDRIIEIGAVKIVNGVITESFHSLINPQKSISKQITDITHITNEDVAHSPLIIDVLGDFYKFCYGCVLVAHNVEFDYAFLKYYAQPAGYVFDQTLLDTIELAKKYFSLPGVTGRPANYQLSTVASKLGVNVDVKHRGLDDAVTCANILLALLAKNCKLI